MQISEWWGKEMWNVCPIIYPALAAPLYDPLSCYRVVFQRTLTWVWSLVYWSLVVQYRTHPTETPNCPAYNLDEFNATKDVFTTYWTSKATESIAHARIADRLVQCKAEHSVKDEKRAEPRDTLSSAPTKHWNTENTKFLQEVYNTTVHKCTSFDFVKIHHILYYGESVPRFGHLVKDSTEMQERNYPIMCIVHYQRWNRNFRYERQILNDNRCIHVIGMQCLHLQHLANLNRRPSAIQEALRLFQPKDWIVVNKCNSEQTPMPENLPLGFCDDEGNIEVCHVRSPSRMRFSVKNEILPMYNYPLI